MKFVGLWTVHGCTVHKKVNICGYCSLNSSRTPPKTRENKKEQNANVVYETWIQTEAKTSQLKEEKTKNIVAK